MTPSTKKQFRILYREFLFRIVDRDLISTHGQGDASKLLLQLVALLIFLSILFSLPVLSALDGDRPAQVRLVFEWGFVHFLIATTMLVVGVFAVLSWESMFASHRDVLVLAPLPVRGRTILLAKLASAGTALGLTILTLHAVAGVAWPFGLNVAAPAQVIPALTSERRGPPVAAADLRAVLDKEMSRALGDGQLRSRSGVTVGVYQRGVRRVLAYGVARPDSIFPIASVTKPFTGLLLAYLAETGKVRLDQPVRELLPGLGLQRPSGDEITLLDLATHHSTLPSMPPEFRPTDRANRLADFSRAKLYSFISRRGVQKRLDAEYRYSNMGFGLLGHVLAARSAMDYESLVRQVITGPLGMPDTVVHLSPNQKGRLLQGYDHTREPVPPWELDALIGAGALRSTAPDLLAWLEANLHPERVPSDTLAAALVSSHQRRADAGGAAGIALGWMLAPDDEGIGHSGSAPGFSADVLFNPKEDLATVVLSNMAIGTAVSADVVSEHVRARLAGRPAISIAEVTIPATGGVPNWFRLLFAYWATMLGAALFVFSLAAGAQGLVASFLPHRHFLRVSSYLQLGALCILVGVYFLQPMLARPLTILLAQQQGLLGSSPSYWFLGLFHQLSGSPVMAPLAHNAWIGLGAAVATAAVAYLLAYVRSFRRIAEEPDITPGVVGLRWLPRFGGGFPTAIVHFSLRTLFRSPQHRVVVAFYWGIGFALTTIFLKTPRGQQLSTAAAANVPWQESSVPLLVSSMWMMGFAVLAAKLAFAIPRDLRANWIFRIAPMKKRRDCAKARRRALMVVSVVPVWTAAAVVFLWMWPWGPALGHLIALALLGTTLTEISLYGVQKLPFTCSYLPGKSRMHVVVYVFFALLLPLTLAAARFERDALQDSRWFSAIVGSLVIMWIAARWRTARLAAAESAEPQFEDEPADRVLTLEVWDSRFANPAGAERNSPW